MAETRRKFDENPAGCRTEWPEETFDALASVDRRSEAWQPRAANERADHCIQCSAGDVSMLSETVHGRLLMTRNARPLARQQV
jgi:hypothetical protein